LKQAIAGSSSSYSLQKNVSSNLSESLSHESEELPIQHSQTPLFEELCVSLRTLLARDCTRPIISSPEPDEDTTESADIKPSLKSGDYMETFYEIQARFGSDFAPHYGFCFCIHLNMSSCNADFCEHFNTEFTCVFLAV
jgi:hypothetical protein